MEPFRAAVTGTRSIPRTRTPTNSVWLGVTLAAIVGAISFLQKGGYSTAFFALTGICVIGLYVSYVIPIFLRLRNPDFVQSEWNLGRWSKVVGWVSVVWVVFITILFFSPIFYPFWPIVGPDSEILGPDGEVLGYKINNFNFTGPLIVLAFIVFGVLWVAWAKKWFKGPEGPRLPGGAPSDRARARRPRARPSTAGRWRCPAVLTGAEPSGSAGRKAGGVGGRRPSSRSPLRRRAGRLRRGSARLSCRRAGRAGPRPRPSRRTPRPTTGCPGW